MNADQDFVLATSSSRSSAPAPLRDASERLVQSLLDHHLQDEKPQEENNNDVDTEDPHDRSLASTGSSLFQTVLSVAKEEAFGSSSSLSPPPPINSKTADRLMREHPKVDDLKRVLGRLGISPTRNYGKTTITKKPHSSSLAINSSLDVPSLTSTSSNTSSKPPLSPSSAQHEEGPQPFQRSSRVERPLHKSPLRKARSTGERVSSTSVTTTHNNKNKTGESRPSANGLRKTHSTNGVTTATSSRRKMDDGSRRRSERRMGEDSSNRRSERRTMKDDSHRRQAPTAAMDDSSRRRSERRLAKDESERRLAKDDSGRRIAMKDESSSSRRRHTHNVSSSSRREATRKIVSKTSGTAVADSAEKEAAAATTQGIQAPRMEDGRSNRRSTATRREGRRRIRKTESTSALESRSSRRSASKSPVLKPNPSSSAATTASSPKTPTRPRRTGSVEGRRRRGPHKHTSLSALPPLTLARAVSDPVAAMVLDHHHHHHYHAEANMDGSAPDHHHTRYNMAEEPTSPHHPQQHRISNNGNSSTSRRERRTPRKSPKRSASSATTTTTTSRQRSPMRRNPQDVMQNQLAQVVLNTTDPLERVLSKTDDDNDHDLPLLDPADVEQQQRHKESLHKTLDNLRKGTFNNNGDSKQSAAPNNNSNGWRLFPVTGTSVGIPIMSSGLKTTNNNDNNTTTPTPGIKMTEMAASAVESARIAAARVAGVAAGAERTKNTALRNGNHPTHQNARAPATVMQDSTSSMDGSLFSFTGLRKHNSDHTRQTTTSSTAAANAGGGGGKFVFGRATTGQQSDHVPKIFGPQLEIPANDDDSVEFF